MGGGGPSPLGTNLGFELGAGVLRQNFKKAVHCLRSIILASEVYVMAQYQYIYAIFIVVLGQDRSSRRGNVVRLSIKLC